MFLLFIDAKTRWESLKFQYWKLLSKQEIKNGQK